MIKAVLNYAWRIIHRLGYSIRKSEDWAWHDQKKLLNDRAEVTIFDVGANCGAITAKYREIFSDAKIYCFEPIPALYQSIVDRFKHDPLVHVVPMACSNRVGQADFYQNQAVDTSSLLAADLQSVPESYLKMLNTSKKITVDLVTIDQFCETQNINQIDLLKLDIQGGELDALKGAERCLEQGKVSLVYTEVFFTPYYNKQPLFGDISNYLSSKGYILHEFYYPSFNGSTGRLQWADCIFLHKKYYNRHRELLKSYMKP